MDFVVRPIEESDWAEYRGIRLEMLQDTPMAFGDTYAEAVQRDEAEWKRRSIGGGTSVRFAAIAADGTWIGSMGCFVEAGVPVLVGVYVAPGYRGEKFGVTSALLDTVEHWASAHGDVIRLDVHEGNDRARAAYAKRGYVETGNTSPYPNDPTARELEMTKHLAPSPVVE